MFLTPRFYYTDNAGEGGGGAAPPVVAPAAPVIPEDVQKELTELRAFKEQIASKQPDKTPQQLAKDAEIEKAEFLKYGAENDLIKVDEYNQYESLKSKADRDLIFEKFSTEVKEELTEELKGENPDITEAEIEEKVKEKFESEYPVNSKNPKTKERAERKLARDAKELRTPLASKYETAQERFKEAQNIVSKIPEFNKAIDEIIKESTPEKIVVKTKDGEQEIDIEVELTKEQRSEIEKLFKSDKVFANYYNSDEKEKGTFKAKVQKKIEGYVKANTFDSAVAKGFEVGKKIGTNQGSTVGANNPFPLKEGQKRETKVVSIDESTAKVAAQREKYGR
jgi:hypothetical protein